MANRHSNCIFDSMFDQTIILTIQIPIHIASDTEKLAMTNLIALAYGVKTGASPNKSAMGAAGALGGIGGANVLGGDFGATH